LPTRRHLHAGWRCLLRGRFSSSSAILVTFSSPFSLRGERQITYTGPALRHAYSHLPLALVVCIDRPAATALEGKGCGIFQTPGPEKSPKNPPPARNRLYSRPPPAFRRRLPSRSRPSDATSFVTKDEALAHSTPGDLVLSDNIHRRVWRRHPFGATFAVPRHRRPFLRTLSRDRLARETPLQLVRRLPSRFASVVWCFFGGLSSRWISTSLDLLQFAYETSPWFSVRNTVIAGANSTGRGWKNPPPQ